MLRLTRHELDMFPEAWLRRYENMVPVANIPRPLTTLTPRAWLMQKASYVPGKQFREFLVEKGLINKRWFTKTGLKSIREEIAMTTEKTTQNANTESAAKDTLNAKYATLDSDLLKKLAETEIKRNEEEANAFRAQADESKARAETARSMKRNRVVDGMITYTSLGMVVTAAGLVGFRAFNAIKAARAASTTTAAE